MINVISFFVLAFLGFIWKSNDMLNVCVKFGVSMLALWHLFVIFETSGYIVKVASGH